ncbi:Putative cell wall binding repeat 2 [Quadrisphaera sp. DSM 44207]|nr:Putative cell wall binding repeat 2 [Quadrisphaera sp. DSM 44207]
MPLEAELHAPKTMAKRAAAGTLALAVCLSGGVALAGAASADANFKFDQRVAGADRTETAVKASQAAYPAGTQAGGVVVVNAWATVDGLAASYAAGLKNAPILYTETDSTAQITLDEIKRLGAKNIWIVGGTTRVSQKLENDWKAAGYTVERLAGADRYETAAKVATAGGTAVEKVFVASGNAPADALAVGPMSYKKKYPILLTETGRVPASTAKALGDLAEKERIVVGGTAVVDEDTALALGATSRLSDVDRQGTAIKVAQHAIEKEGFSVADLALVGGGDNNAADALVAAPLAGKGNGVPLVFTRGNALGQSTTDYIKANFAKLTGKGWVFGGTAAVAQATAEEATKAAVGVVVAGYAVVDLNLTNNKFSYSDPTTKKVVEVTIASTDAFSVDGASASFGAFKDALSLGDVVSVSKDSAGKQTLALASKTVLAGLVGGAGAAGVDTTGGNVAFLDAVSGLAISGAITYKPTAAVYTVDGVSATLADFEANLNEGDTIAITGGDGTTGKTRTFALTNQTVTGVVSGNSSGALTIETIAGAKLGTYTAGASDSVTIDGAASVNTTLASSATVGDAVTYKKVNGVQTFTLVNAAPASVTGTFQSVSGTNVLTFFTGAGSATGTVDISTGYTYKVDGSVVTLAEFKDAATAGDEIVYQSADTTTNTKASIMLTSKSVSGKIDAATVNTTAKTAAVLFGETTTALATVNYSTVIYAGNTASTYWVNDAQKSFAQFEAELEAIKGLGRTGALTVVDNGTTTEFRIKSTVAAAAPVSVAKPTAPSTTTSVTLTFNHPVYLSGAAAPSDFVITKTTAGGAVSSIGYVSATPTTLTGASTSVTLTTASTTWAAGDVLSVQLTDTGAAKWLDVDGKAVTPKTVVAPGA